MYFIELFLELLHDTGARRPELVCDERSRFRNTTIPIQMASNSKVLYFFLPENFILSRKIPQTFPIFKRLSSATESKQTHGIHNSRQSL